MKNVYDVLEKELIITEGEISVYGKIYLPDTEEKRPAIIFSHGYNGCHSDFEVECRYFAENGFVAYAYDFCGGSSRSKSSRRSTEMTLSTEKADLITVFNYIYQMEQVDSNNVFLLGGSQGGMISALVSAELKEKVRALSLYFPALCIVEDWKKKYTDLSKVEEKFDFWGLTLGRGFVEDLWTIDVFGTIGNYKGNVYILHGDKDDCVPYAYSERAVETYDNAVLVNMEGEGHGFSPEGGKIAMQKVLEFCTKNLI